MTRGKVIIGGVPISLAGHPQQLFKLGVRGVVNCMAEHSSPCKSDFIRLGCAYHYAPSIDHTEPSVESMFTCVEFMRRIIDKGHAVYVHCRGGHGRSAAVVVAFLMSVNEGMTPKKPKLYLIWEDAHTVKGSSSRTMLNSFTEL